MVDERAELGDRSTADSARALVCAGLASPPSALLGFADAKAVQLRPIVGVPRGWSFRRVLGERVQRRRVVLDLQRQDEWQSGFLYDVDVGICRWTSIDVFCGE